MQKPDSSVAQATADAIPSSTPVIYQLAISRFRGIKSLTWYPGKGTNLILGGGNVGKTSILDAIGLLLSPTNATSLSDTDYYLRDVAAEFTIEAIVSLPMSSGTVNQQFKQAWPWAWDGNAVLVPSIDNEGPTATEPVYRLRVRGTSDLELAFEIVQPDGATDHLSVALRRSIGLVRLSGDDRSDRDLRLVQGSALDRLLSDKTLRSRIASELAKADVQVGLAPEAKVALKSLDDTFAELSLPTGLDISITGGPGASVASLIGLRATYADVRLPLTSWGAGTRRLAALAIAEHNQGEHPVVLADEIERGLEPYRQRKLFEKIQKAKSQAFVTTHSPAVISAGANASLWYVDAARRIGSLAAAKIATHLTKDPEMFLARVAIVAEGLTEVGFVSALLEAALGSSLLQHGVHVSDGGGNDGTLDLLEALAEGGLCVGGFADDEGRNPNRWNSVMAAHGDLVFRWPSGCIEANVINAIDDEQLGSLLTDADGEESGVRLRTLADRLDMDRKEFELIKGQAGSDLRALIVDASTGAIPNNKTDQKKQYKAHAQHWFKSLNGGRELAGKVPICGAWPALKPQVLPFCNAVRHAIGLPAVTDVTL
jgi:putative ATP-dependent endonuclease of OLD family